MFLHASVWVLVLPQVPLYTKLEEAGQTDADSVCGLCVSVGCSVSVLQSIGHFREHHSFLRTTFGRKCCVTADNPLETYQPLS